MSKESLDYLKLWPNYYTNWEDGCCMENCTENSLDQCPIHYVKGLLEEKDKAITNWETMYKGVMQTCGNDAKEIKRLREQLTLTKKALELACEEINRVEAKFGSAYIRANGYLVDYFKTEAKEIMKSE